MALIEQNISVYRRDEAGKVIAREVELKLLPKGEDGKHPSVKISPMTRGEMQRIFADIVPGSEKEKELEQEILIKHCMHPVYKKEDFDNDNIAPHIANAIMIAIVSESSGMTQEKINDLTLKQVLKQTESDFKKKSENLKPNMENLTKSTSSTDLDTPTLEKSA